MKLNIGENIRRMRALKGVTQEKLAEALGVSCQSVSRWELNICYPDMELLPAIADYFDTTIDDLMGMGDVRSKPRKDAVFTEALDLERRDDWPGAVQVLESALKAWPSDFGLRAELAMALSMTGERQDLVRAIAVSEDVLENCPDEKLLSTVRASLCYLYKAAGQPEKALALGRTLPHIWESREMLLPGLVPEKERAAQVERSLNIALQVMGDMAGNRPIPFSLGYRPEADVDTTGLLAALGGE